MTFNIVDELKHNTNQMIKYFKNNNIHTSLISGDSEQKCIDIQSKTNIEKIDVESPNIQAWFFVTFPVGIGLRHVLFINASWFFSKI